MQHGSDIGAPVVGATPHSRTEALRNDPVKAAQRRTCCFAGLHRRCAVILSMLHAMIGRIRVDPRHSSEQPVTLTVRIVLLGFFAMCTGTALAAAPVFFGLRFPDTVAGFRRGAITDFEKDHPGLGYGVRYSGNGWAIDVFIYDDGYKDLPDSLSAELWSASSGRREATSTRAKPKGTSRSRTRTDSQSRGPTKRCGSAAAPT